MYGTMISSTMISSRNPADNFLVLLQVPVLDRKEPSVEVRNNDRHPGNPLRGKTAS